MTSWSYLIRSVIALHKRVRAASSVPFSSRVTVFKALIPPLGSEQTSLHRGQERYKDKTRTARNSDRGGSRIFERGAYYKKVVF